MPLALRQFVILYRDFLTRILDLELLSSRGEIQRLLAQFAAGLAAFSFVSTLVLVQRYLFSTLPWERMRSLALVDADFFIATTMAIAGLFTVLAWNAVLPDRRDCLILGLLPIRSRTIFAAKLAALLTTLAVNLTALNFFTGLTFPFALAPVNAGALQLLRVFAAWWITQAAAGLLVCGALLAMQGLAAQVLPYRAFLRLSSFLQLGSFFLILGVYFLKPPFPIKGAAPGWVPSFWFVGLFQKLSGGGPAFAPLAARAALSLLITIPIAVFAFALAYHRNRRILEQPDVAPGGARTRACRVGTRADVWRTLTRSPLHRALLLFTARTIARSRHHRLLLAAYGGVGLAIALAYVRELLYGAGSVAGLWPYAPWNHLNAPLLMASQVLLFFAVIGGRAISALPMALPANWIFRVTAVHSPAAYAAATRKSLLWLCAFPVWIVCAAVFLIIWPLRPALEHIVLLGVFAFLLTNLALHGFRKIPFACSYLPGKANLHVRAIPILVAFLSLGNLGAALEYRALQSLAGFAGLLAVLVAAAFWAHRRAVSFPIRELQFEDLPPAEIEALNLHGDGGSSGGNYIDLLASPAPVPKTPFSLEQFFRDLAGGTRILTRSPGFSAAAIALIALGLGWNTTIYSIVHSILSKPAPGIAASGLVSFGVTIEGRHADPGENSLLEYLEYAANTRSMQSLAGAAAERFNMVLPNGASYRLRGTLVTLNYFETLGVRMTRGRVFTEDELRGTGPLAAIITDAVWRNQFQTAPDILGRAVLLNGRAATIVGVAPPHFHGTSFAPNLEICVPILAYARRMASAAEIAGRFGQGIFMIGRLAPGMSLRSAQAEFDHLSPLLESIVPGVPHGKRILLAPYSATAFGPNSGPQARLFMAIVMGVTLLTLVIVCANVANLMLARAISRQREIALRLAMGASASRLLRMLFAEGLALSLSAAAVAWLFASWATRFLVSLIPPTESGARFDIDLTPDWRVAAYALLLALLSSFAFTVAPALRAVRQDLLPSLKTGEQGVIRGRSTAANVLVIAQLALCVVLLIGGGLASRSLALIDTADLGFRKDHLLLAAVDMAGVQESPAVLLERLRQRLLVVPGVTSVSWAVAAPPHGHGWMGIPASAAGSSRSVPTHGTFAGPDYLRTLDVPILAGRDFSPADMLASQLRVVINRKLADALWPGASPLGRIIALGQGTHPLEVVGVVPDAAFSGVAEDGSFSGLAPSERRPFVFLADAQPAPERTLHIRYTGSLTALVPAVRAAIRQIDTRLSVFSVRTLDSEWRDFTMPIRAIVNLLALFALGALAMASIGLYAVIAFYTAKRTREFGVRMALGATPRQILRAVLQEALLLAAAGLALGLGLCAAAGRALGHLLFGISPTDARTYLAVAAALTFVALLACYLPARRAARIDPLQALRED